MKTIVLLAAITLAGCAAQPRAVQVMASYDADEAINMLRPGANTISGSALIRQRGGGVVTCAGNKVNLIPATNYAEHRIQTLYGGRKAITPAAASLIRFEPDPPAYHANVRSTTCDAQGFFKFANVADGSFFVQTTVIWQVGNLTQGGALLDRVSVRGGESTEITLAP